MGEVLPFASVEDGQRGCSRPRIRHNGGFFGLGRGPDIGPDPRAGPWFWNTFPRTTIVIVALGLVLAGGASRVVRGAVISVAATDYVQAAVVLGASPWGVMTRHVLPNIMPTVIVLATLQLGTGMQHSSLAGPGQSPGTDA